MEFDVPPARGLRAGARNRRFHGLVFAWSLAVSLVSSGGTSRAEVAIQRDVGDYLMRAIEVCWVMPADTKRIARVRISLNKDGSLAGPPKILGPVTPPLDKVAEAAIRAITRCAPFPRLISYAAHYDLSRDVVLTFNPGEASPSEPPAANGIDKLLEKYGKKAK